MRKSSLIILLIAASFVSGFAFKSIMTPGSKDETKPIRKVTGIGGIFFKCKDPAKLKEWYSKHLGIHTDKYGAVFEWRQALDSTQKGYTSWGPFSEKTTYFEPSTKDFMINYRVENLTWLVDELKKNGVTVVDTIETYDYGKFVHILDLEGNKLELWEPKDTELEQIGKKLGTVTTK